MSGRRVRVRVSGRVQGVFFRGATERRARELGLAGWVRNLPDGRVEALFEGEPAAVEQAIAFARSGPEAARVEVLELIEEDYLGEPAGFRVRR